MVATITMSVPERVDVGQETGDKIKAVFLRIRTNQKMR